MLAHKTLKFLGYSCKILGSKEFADWKIFESDISLTYSLIESLLAGDKI